MQCKLLALDLDGTLLNSKGLIDLCVENAIKRLSGKVEVIIVTGRHHTAAKAYHSQLALSSPIICCNGTYVYDYKEDKVLFENSISKDIGLKLLTKIKEHNCKVLMYTTAEMNELKTNPVDFIKQLRNWSKTLPASLRPKLQSVASFSQTLMASEYLWKFVIEGDITSSGNLIETSFIQENFSVEQSHENRFDFSAKGNSKGKALANYINKRSIKPSEIIAIGDNHNDISMLSFAGIGVSMSNADKKVKACANLVTSKSNDEFGILEIIEKIK